MKQVMSLAAYKCSEVTRPVLSTVALPDPTETYCPIGHDTVLDLAEDFVVDRGFRFGEMHLGLSHDGARFFGLINIMGGPDNPEYSTLLGVINSIDKRLPLRLLGGNGVSICANLSFWGEFMSHRKHSKFALRDLPGIMKGLIDGVLGNQLVQHQRFEAYKQAKLGDTMAHHLMIEALRRGAVNTSRLEKVVTEYHEPSFAHEGPGTVWRLFNAATEALKGVNIFEMPARTIALQSLCDEAVGYTPLAAAA